MWRVITRLLISFVVFGIACAQTSASGSQPNGYQANINAQVDITPLYNLVNSLQGSQQYPGAQYSSPYGQTNYYGGAAAGPYGQQQQQQQLQPYGGANAYGLGGVTAYPTYGQGAYGGAQYGGSQYTGNPYGNAQYGAGANSGSQYGTAGYDPSNPVNCNTGLYANLDGGQLNVGFNNPYQQTSYDQQTGSSSTGTGGRNGFVVQNPNAQFVPQLRSFFDQIQSGKTIDFNGHITASGTGSGTAGTSTDAQSNAGRSATQGQFTNNIYGYDYRSNPDMKYTVNGNEAQYQPPEYRKIQAPPGSAFGRKRRQAPYPAYNGRSPFTGTAYENQDIPFQRDNSIMQQQPLYYPAQIQMNDKAFPNAPRSNWQFYDPGMNMTAMYYPFRTTVQEHPIGG